MQYEFLRDRLLRDLSLVGCPTEFELCIKDYSKTFYGCYRPKTNRVYLYYYSDENRTEPYPYSHMLDLAIHEAVHAEQWNNPDFVRVRGVMHNEEFYRLYDKYTNVAKEMRLYEESEDFSKKGMERDSDVPVKHVKKHFIRNNLGASSFSSSSVLRVACKRRS